MTIKKIKKITLIAVLTICAMACGQKQSKTGKENMESVKENMKETITKDILSLPEMQFPHAAAMIVDEPTADQPYFTVKGGSNMDDHFATSFWFRVYTAPEYEIRLYDIVFDSEMTLSEWRSSKPKYDEVLGQTKTDIQSISHMLAEQVPEINEKYDRIHSNDEYYLYRYAENAEYGRKNLQMYWYERPTAANDWVLVSYNYPPEPWLKCFIFDRKTEALKETDLLFTIPPAHEFDREEFDREQTYWRSEYTICENGDVVISASPGMSHACVMLFHWDKKGSFTLYKRGIDIYYGAEPVEDDAAAEKYVQNVVRPNFQRINAMNNWAWTDKKTVRDISPQDATLTYYYSEKGLEKITASLADETVEYYFLDRYLFFVYSKSSAGKERRWYVKKGSCFRGIGDNDKKLSSDAREEEYGEVYSLFSKIIVR